MSIGRIPIVDVQPRILDGARPAKAVPGELFTVTATVFREGHDAVAASVGQAVVPSTTLQMSAPAAARR